MTTYDMNDLTMDLTTLGVWILRRVILCCRRFRKSSDGVSVTFRQVTPNRVLEEGDPFPKTLVLQTWTHGDFKRSWVQYDGETVASGSDAFDARPVVPWVWIGYKTVSGDMIDLTDDLKEFVLPGNVIKPQLVHTLFPRLGDPGIVYVEPTTFTLKDLSSDGLVIEDLHEDIPPPPPPSTDVPASE